MQNATWTGVRPLIVSTNALTRLLEQTSRTLHAVCSNGDLYPAQWTALRYFGSCDPEHRTAAALARYQGMATGPVTRTVRTLIAKGLVDNEGKSRGRGRRVALTRAGAELLEGDPLRDVAIAVESLDADQRYALASALEAILRRMQASRARSGSG